MAYDPEKAARRMTEALERKMVAEENGWSTTTARTEARLDEARKQYVRLSFRTDAKRRRVIWAIALGNHRFQWVDREGSKYRERRDGTEYVEIIVSCPADYIVRAAEMSLTYARLELA